MTAGIQDISRDMTVTDWLGAENEVGISIWEKKYRYKDETFSQWLDRVSGNDPEVRKLILEKKFLFGGRILANRGLQGEKKISMSNCYVIEPPEDNIESIFECAKKLARTYSYGGGCGVDISKLAPKGAKVRNAANESSGAVSFMDLYSMVTGLISQNGRRGALMISMDVNHPDIEDFIDIKKDLDRVTKASSSPHNVMIARSTPFPEARCHRTHLSNSTDTRTCSNSLTLSESVSASRPAPRLGSWPRTSRLLCTRRTRRWLMCLFQIAFTVAPVQRCACAGKNSSTTFRNSSRKLA